MSKTNSLINLILQYQLVCVYNICLTARQFHHVINKDIFGHKFYHTIKGERRERERREREREGEREREREREREEEECTCMH